jgi:hypothetical protein
LGSFSDHKAHAYLIAYDTSVPAAGNIIRVNKIPHDTTEKAMLELHVLMMQEVADVMAKAPFFNGTVRNFQEGALGDWKAGKK